MAAWYLYVLECARGVLYAGISPDVAVRFERHRAGQGGAFTRAHPPVRVLAAQAYGDRGEATRAEAALKKLSRAEKLAWVAAHPWVPESEG